MGYRDFFSCYRRGRRRGRIVVVVDDDEDYTPTHYYPKGAVSAIVLYRTGESSLTLSLETLCRC